jgi:endoglucanase
MNVFARALLPSGLLLALPGAAFAASPVSMTNGLYVNPNNTAAAWVAANPTDGRMPSIRDAIASRPMAEWFGSWSGAIGTAVGSYVGRADAADRLPVLVAYNLPGRDACGGHSGGGAGTPSAYYSWIAAFADSIRSRPAVVILEPDSLADFNCMTSAAIATRTALLTFATQQLRDRSPNTWAYLDGGNAGWVAADVMAARLHSAGLANIRGFSINVSSFYTTSQSVNYGNAVNAALSRSHGYTRPFVIDTSRNGNGHNGQWCNPPGRRLGTTPRVGGGAEMLLWIKMPGKSDGNCGTAPTTPAGTFHPELAYRLVYGY